MYICIYYLCNKPQVTDDSLITLIYILLSINKDQTKLKYEVTVDVAQLTSYEVYNFTVQAQQFFKFKF